MMDQSHVVAAVRYALDPALATVIIALIAAVLSPIVSAVVKHVQDKKLAAVTGGKLDIIHHVINGRLAEAQARIAQLEALLTELAPGDPRWERRTR